jgi:hypothetical protein
MAFTLLPSRVLVRVQVRFSVRVLVLLFALAPLAVTAQGRRASSSSSFRQAVEYDGSLVLTRLTYGSGLGGFGFGGSAWSGPARHHCDAHGLGYSSCTATRPAVRIP